MTISKMLRGRSPFGSPTITMVPPRRQRLTADLKAPMEGARHNTPWDPPFVVAMTYDVFEKQAIR
jgi:hypothetical protein